MRSGNSGYLLLIGVESSVGKSTIKVKHFLVVVALLPARVVNMRANLVAGDDGSYTTGGTTLTGRHGDQRFRTGRSEADGGGERQSESREVLHCLLWMLRTRAGLIFVEEADVVDVGECFGKD